MFSDFKMKCRYCDIPVSRLSRRVKCPCKQAGIVYCSKQCQSKDWIEGQHRKDCTYKVQRSEKKRDTVEVDKTASENLNRRSGNIVGGENALNSGLVKRHEIDRTERVSQSKDKSDRNLQCENSSREKNKSSDGVIVRKKLVSSKKIQQGRNEKGRFMSNGTPSERKRNQVIATKNYTDFKAATKRLQSIVGILGAI